METQPTLKEHWMKLKELFNQFELTSIRLSPTGAQIEMQFNESDKDAAWELYIEMLTRITTQPLPNDHGDEKAALTSLYNLFPTTREILRRKGRKTIQFTKIAIPVLNQIIRPFTAKWHRESLAGAFDDNNRCCIFRQELEDLQKQLRNYNKMLAHIAEVEDLSDLEENVN